MLPFLEKDHVGQFKLEVWSTCPANMQVGKKREYLCDDISSPVMV
ncbi:Hypothetical protein GSB_150892 [Giardia duodenalis]|uniref:Uncharacterized protein n=1 Tax=Giardia intestinalis TaxID=5741 RepID=V6TUB5_GIAIN|nr:Hypothetical protein GSB_150892 [Giardia intestinalis]